VRPGGEALYASFCYNVAISVDGANWSMHVLACAEQCVRKLRWPLCCSCLTGRKAKLAMTVLCNVTSTCLDGAMWRD
jgi:hypothetical protein